MKKEKKFSPTHRSCSIPKKRDLKKIPLSLKVIFLKKEKDKLCILWKKSIIRLIDCCWVTLQQQKQMPEDKQYLHCSERERENNQNLLLARTIFLSDWQK